MNHKKGAVKMIPRIHPSELLTFQTVKEHEKEDFDWLQIGWEVQTETDDSIVFQLKDQENLVCIKQDHQSEEYLSEQFPNFHFVCFDTEFKFEERPLYDYTVYFQEKSERENVYSLNVRYNASELNPTQSMRNQSTGRTYTYEYMNGNDQERIREVTKSYWNCLNEKNPVRLLAVTGTLNLEDLL